MFMIMRCFTRKDRASAHRYTQIPFGHIPSPCYARPTGRPLFDPHRDAPRSTSQDESCHGTFEALGDGPGTDLGPFGRPQFWKKAGVTGVMGVMFMEGV